MEPMISASFRDIRLIFDLFTETFSKTEVSTNSFPQRYDRMPPSQSSAKAFAGGGDDSKDDEAFYRALILAWRSSQVCIIINVY